MKPLVHRIYIGSMAVAVLAALVYLAYSGFEFYRTGLEERFYHPDYEFLKPSGAMGHGLGILGSLLMLIGVSFYMMRKRIRALARLGTLKHWLELHIFLCVLGPVLVLFHTSFKFGGLVSISFWSMVAVFLSGIAGRFIYIRIPRTIEGRELSLDEIREMKTDVQGVLEALPDLDTESIETILESTRTNDYPDNANPISQFFRKNQEDRRKVRSLRKALKKTKLSGGKRSEVMKLVKNEISLNRRIDRLKTMQNLFKYWHVAHLPFALIMLIIMVIHVAVTIVFGYKWIL